MELLSGNGAMEDRDDDWELPDTAPIRPKSLGRGLPVPPVLPVVASLCIMFGLAMGYRIAPAPTPTPAPSDAAPSLIAVATPTESLQPSAEPTPLRRVPGMGFVDASPPVGGVGLDELLKDLAGRNWSIATESVVSARVAHYNEVSSVQANSRRWVWVVVFRQLHSFMLPGACPVAPSVGPEPSAAACPSVESTWTLILDYETGGFLEWKNWAVG